MKNILNNLSSLWSWIVTGMGGFVGWILDPTHIIQILTILLLLTQLIIFIPRAYRGWRKSDGENT